MTGTVRNGIRKTPRTVDVPIVLDDDWGRRCLELESEIGSLERATASTLTPAGRAAAERLADARESLEKLLSEKDDKVQVFRFKAIGNPRYEALVAAHPPSKEDRTRAAAAGESPPPFDSGRFEPALVSACLVDPQLSARDVWLMFHPEDADPEDGEPDPGELDGLWNTAELSALFNGAMSATLNRHRLG